MLVFVKQNHRKFPKHTHIGGEEFLVLEGTFHDQYGSFPTGSYVRNPIGTEHAPWVEDDGCTIMVKLLQMDDPTSAALQLDTPLHIQWETAKTEIGQSVEYGTVAQIYTNDRTGEIVEICWIDPNSMLPADIKCIGGEELFLISGSLELVDQSNGTNETYHKWGWMRFPPKTTEETWPERQPLVAGATGAVVYRKTGHLTDKALAMEKIQIKDDD